jgi:uncharacterized membrane protein
MEPGTPLRRALWTAVIFLSVIGVAVALRRMVHLERVLINGYHPPTPPTNPASAQFSGLDDIFARHPVLTLVHVIPGLLFMILGPIQFNSTIRSRHIRWHRLCGHIFVVCGMIIGTTAVVMSFTMQAIGGVNQAVATILFGLFFLFSLCKAFWHIRHWQIALHREWMIRAFSIGLAVATIRPIVGIFFATSRASGLTPGEFFGTAFWIGFVLHLIAAEAWIRLTMPRLTTAA